MLTELELVEISLVTMPMQPKARVHMVEDDGSTDEDPSALALVRNAGEETVDGEAQAQGL